MPITQTRGRLVAVLAMVSLAVGIAVPSTAGAAPRAKASSVPPKGPHIEDPCSVVPPPAATYDFPVPAADPTPVDPLATVPSAGGGTFVDTVTGQPFVPRGAHYVRLATVALSHRYTVCMSSDFDTGTGLDHYNPNRAAQALSQMHADGYNEVSVGLNPFEIGNPSGTGLDPAYLANVASFINIARADDIRVLIALMPLPQNGGYLPTQPGYTTVGLPKYHDANLYYIDANYLVAEQRYISDFVTGLTGAGANMSDIFSLELVGEAVYRSNQWPLNLTKGLVQTDGRTQPYDMADPSSRNQLMDANLLHWENQLTGTIHTDLPGTLVSVGFFPPYALVHFPSARVSRPTLSLSTKSDVDFVDIHMYPKFGPMADQLHSLGVSSSSVTKPIVLGEFGEYATQAPTPEVAAADLVTWQDLSCRVGGFRFDGWLTWTWDTLPSEQIGIYNMVDGNGAIASALAPNVRTDPCTPQRTSVHPSVYPRHPQTGQRVTYSAIVRVPGAAPTGTVTFTTGSTYLCATKVSALTTQAASGTCAAANAPMGSDDIRATYSGDENFTRSSGEVSLRVESPSSAPPAPPVANGSLPAPVVGMASLPDGSGYWLADSAGGISAHGDAIDYGSLAGQALNAPITHIVATPDGLGYWLVAQDGGTFAFGDAGFYGSMGGKPLNAPVVDIAPTADGRGYWLVASDGGIFAFGDALFQGSMGGQHLNEPVVGLAADNRTGGYWEVSSDGGIFAFDAPFLGSTGAIVLNEPVNGMTATGDDQGYLFVASDGGIFTYGDAGFYGSMGGSPLNTAIVGLATDDAGGGYWLVGADGGIFNFGAPFYGAD